jgi:hypothetical protein
MNGARIVAVGRVDEVGIRGSRGVDITWDALGCAAPGDARTLRAIGGGPDETFRRLDHVSRALVLAASAAAADEIVPAAMREHTAIVVATRLGSLDADLRFAQSMRRGMCDGPIFPYTLPSTCLGELALRYGFRGPSSCLSVEADGTEAFDEVLRLLRTGEATWAVAALVEVMCEPCLSEAPTCRALVGVATADPEWVATMAWPEASANRLDPTVGGEGEFA